VCEALRALLESAFAHDQAADTALNGLEVDFKLFKASELQSVPTKPRITIFLYRVLPNLSHRTPPGRVLPDGRRQRTRLPLDLEILVTIWATDHLTQAKLVGWAARTLDDYPTLPPPLMNDVIPGTFSPNEDVQFVMNEMTLEVSLELWERLTGAQLPLQVSLPYVVRAVHIESRRLEVAGGPVQVREFDMRRLVEEI
jgi:hypothetical protein